jgi:hypothetical protein
MIVKTRLAEIQDEFAPHFENVCLKGHGLSSFFYVANKGRAVEISEENGGYWLEFWEKSDDEDAAPVKELSVAHPDQAVREAKRCFSS